MFHHHSVIISIPKVSVKDKNMKIARKKESRNYITNKKLYTEMIEYRTKLLLARQEGKPLPQISRFIGEAIDLLCVNLAKKVNFSGYTTQWKQEMISDGMADCVAAVDNFDPDKTNNPFGYFTMVAWNAFIRRIHKEKKQTYIKHKNFENSFLTSSEWNEAENNQLKANEYSNEIVKSFETKLTKTKKAAKVKSDAKNLIIGDLSDEE